MLVVCLFAINWIILLSKYYTVFFCTLTQSKFPLYAALENPSLSLVVFAWKFRLDSIDGHVFWTIQEKTIAILGKVILHLGFHMVQFPSSHAKVVTVWHCQVQAKAKATCEAMMSAEGDASHWDEGHETKHKLGLQWWECLNFGLVCKTKKIQGIDFNSLIAESVYLIEKHTLLAYNSWYHLASFLVI